MTVSPKTSKEFHFITVEPKHCMMPSHRKIYVTNQHVTNILSSDTHPLLNLLLWQQLTLIASCFQALRSTVYLSSYKLEQCLFYLVSVDPDAGMIKAGISK